MPAPRPDHSGGEYHLDGRFVTDVPGLHRAIADYGPDDIRLIRRCQVMATKVFDPEFLRPARELATAGIDEDLA